MLAVFFFELSERLNGTFFLFEDKHAQVFCSDRSKKFCNILSYCNLYNFKEILKNSIERNS